jgi:hypothetical protein
VLHKTPQNNYIKLLEQRVYTKIRLTKTFGMPRVTSDTFFYIRVILVLHSYFFVQIFLLNVKRTLWIDYKVKINLKKLFQIFYFKLVTYYKYGYIKSEFRSYF